MLNLINNNHVFHKKSDVIELSGAMEYMILPENLTNLIPLNIEKKFNVKTITIGIQTHSFVYANVYKQYIEGFITKYFLSKYKINIIFTPL